MKQKKAEKLHCGKLLTSNLFCDFQDPIHKVENLLHQSSQWKRWLCSSGDRSGSIQALFQLEKAAKIGYVDLGRLWIVLGGSGQARAENSQFLPRTKYAIPNWRTVLTKEEKEELLAAKI